MVKVALCCTSANELKGHPTGVWIEEVATPYYLFKEKGYEVEIASPAGGAIPIDQASLGEGFCKLLFAFVGGKEVVRIIDLSSFIHSQLLSLHS